MFDKPSETNNQVVVELNSQFLETEVSLGLL